MLSKNRTSYGNGPEEIVGHVPGNLAADLVAVPH
jgi:hypothetical protein